MMSENEKITILVFHYDGDRRKEMVNTLSGEGYDVMGVEPGEACLEYAAQKKPDLILLDIATPASSGFNVLHVLLNDTSFSRTSVILITNDDSKGDPQAEAVEKGAVAAVSAGVSARELIARLNAVVRFIKAEKALEKAYAHLSNLGRLARIGGWMVDVENNAVDWSEGLYRIHELPYDYLPPIEDEEVFFHPDNRDRLMEAYQKALSKGEPYDMKLRFITAEGRHLFVRTICEPEMDGGNVIKLNGIFQDITDIQEDAAQNREKGKNYYQAVDHLDEGIWFIDEYNNTVYVNSAAAKMLGYSADDMIGEKLYNFLDDKGLDVCAQYLDQMKSGEKGFRELKLIHKDGSMVSILMSALPMLDDQWSYIGYVAGFTNLRDQKEAENNLVAGMNIFRAVFKQSRMGLAGINEMGKFSFANKVVEDILGYTKQELLQMGFADITHKDDVDESLMVRKSLLKGAYDAYNIQKRYICKDGNVVHVLLKVKLVKNIKNNKLDTVAQIREVFGISDDGTDRT